MSFNSQAGQDRFAFHALEIPSRISPGTFLDIGSNHPIIENNSYLFETLGWKGICVEIQGLKFETEYAKKRPNTVLLSADASLLDWDALLMQHAWLANGVDYLSLDVDNATLPTLRRMPLDKIRFKVLTVEHDAYRIGGAVREEMRKIFNAQGYKLICSDVQVMLATPVPFEDWWVDPQRVNMNVVNKFQCANRLWKSIFGCS